MTDTVNDKTGVDFRNISLEEAKKVCQQFKVDLEKHEESLVTLLISYLKHYGEEDLIEPTLFMVIPEISPLAKKNPLDPRFTERFELYINKMEYSNAFSELNDPIDQKQRFENQLRLKELGDDEASEMDIDYVEALEYGLPPTGGIGIGIDRLAMLLLGTDSIRRSVTISTYETSGVNNNILSRMFLISYILLMYFLKYLFNLYKCVIYFFSC